MNWNNQLPDTSRFWAFALDKAPDHPREMLEVIGEFLASWESHGRRVVGSCTLMHERFLVVAGFIPSGGEISGCGVDSMFRAVNGACRQAGTLAHSPLLVHYRDDTGAFSSTSRRKFRVLVDNGTVGPSTGILDLSLTTLGAFRAGGFERQLHQSWFASVLQTSEQHH